MKIIINGLIYVNGHFLKDHVLIFNELIEDIKPISDLNLINYETIIDAEGMLVVPGFIDVHIHGYKGYDVMDGEALSIETIQKNILENGVTSFLPTTMTMAEAAISKALAVIETVQKEDKGHGARILGVHLEGPFINPDYKGAQAKEAIIAPNKALIEGYKELIKVITIAPEIEGASQMIETYSKEIRFSLGHSGATYEEAMLAFDQGASCVTHIFNAMTGLHHRKPGVVGAAFNFDCYCEVISDDIHVDPNLYQLLVKVKGLKKLLLITDCMRAGGLLEGGYDLGGQQVTVKAGAARLDSGVLAGSVLKLNQGLHNFEENVIETLEALMPLVTINQATYLGLEDQIGSLEVGKIADIVVMNPSCDILKTIVKGKVLYETKIQ